MLVTTKLEILKGLIAESSQEELIWINGFISGVVSVGTKPEVSKQIIKTPGKITLAYGTETGNSKGLASKLAAAAKQKGVNVKLIGLDQYRLTDLTKEENLIIVLSTQGEGEPPAAAKKFYDHLHIGEVKLNSLKYAVVALGDSSYPLFCKAGEDVDLQLEKLGAQRLHGLQKCDTDYEGVATEWFKNALERLSSGSTQSSSTVSAPKTSGKKVYEGKILNNINLNDIGSNKETYHLEIAAEDLSYSPGDAIGIVPENSKELVEEIINLTKIDKTKLLNFKEESVTVEILLKKKLSINYLPERVVKKYASIVKQEIPDVKISLVELLKIYPVKDDSQFEEVVGILEPITPRLYSISSSPEAHQDEVHITVARDKFKLDDEIKYGLCSNYLAEFKSEDELNFYVHKNNHFRLPAEDKDVIMIGPGTGLAPFRSFLSERDSIGASGKNWLFFGEQHFVTDFLYQTEIQNWNQTGLLTKVNVAFSRDQKEKVYVQNKIQEQGAEFFDWVENGAYIYLCGAKEPMSFDVENTLLQVIQQFGGKSESQAIEYLEGLKESGRYLKDVY